MEQIVITLQTDICDHIPHQRTVSVATVIYRCRNLDDIHSSARGLEATAYDAIRFGSVCDFGLVKTH